MAFLKFVASIALGGGLGYTLFKIATPNEPITRLPPPAAEKYSILVPTYKQPLKFMNEEKAKVSNVSSLKDFENQNSVIDIEK